MEGVFQDFASWKHVWMVFPYHCDALLWTHYLLVELALLRIPQENQGMAFYNACAIPCKSPTHGQPKMLAYDKEHFSPFSRLSI